MIFTKHCITATLTLVSSDSVASQTTSTVYADQKYEYRPAIDCNLVKIKWKNLNCYDLVFVFLVNDLISLIPKILK